MAVLADYYIKIETLKEMLHVMEVKQLKGIALTISISDEASEYGSNVRVFVSQSKEERDQKKKQFTMGYGKVFWVNQNGAMIIKKQEAQQSVPQAPAQYEATDLTGNEPVIDDLPF